MVEQLTRHGRSPSTPIALIRWGTRPSQEVVTGTLESILERAGPMSPPTLIVVGEVVRLREQLRWFDNRPLFGKRVLITRPATSPGISGERWSCWAPRPSPFHRGSA